MKCITHLCMHTSQTQYLWLWPKRPPLAFSVAETSMAEMSRPKRPRPKCPRPKCPSTNFNRDKGLDQIRNMFSMTTKCLDQIRRAGAFHHIIHRTVTKSDTSLYELDDAL